MPSAAAASTSASPASSSSSQLIDNHVSSTQVLKALNALVAHASKHAAEASSRNNVLPLDGDGGKATPAETIWLNVAVKKLSGTKPAKPVQLSVPHAPYPAGTPTLLLVKDPQRTYKDLLVEHKIKSVTRVVGVTKLKGKFAPFEARRQLMNEHDVFLADDRIVRMLPKLLGSKWAGTKKQPVPVDVAHTKNGALKRNVEKAIASTYFLANKGSQSSIRIGTLTHLTPTQLSENIAAAIPQIVRKIPGGWGNVQNVEVKTGQSAALPVWNCDVGSRFEVVEAGEGESEEVESDEEGSEEEDDKEDTEKPKGKAKGSAAAKKVDAAKEAKKRSSTSKAAVKASGKASTAKGVEGEAKKSKAGAANAAGAKKGTKAESAGSKATQKKVKGLQMLEKKKAAAGAK